MAQLLGVTPKAIRHYQRLGLLAELERTEGNYRLFGATELMRLLRIRRLQALGLSLRQIRAILGAPESERSMRQVLEELAAEFDSQIAALQARRDRIYQLLEESGCDIADRSSSDSAILALARAEIARQGLAVSKDLLLQDTRLLGLLEDLQWPGMGLKDLLAAERAIFADSDQHRTLLEWAEGFAGLAHVAEDDPVVVRLADKLRTSPELRAFIAVAPKESYLDAPFGNMLQEVLFSTLSPAQLRCLDLACSSQEDAR
jgi:DNA-binding transcriptional MerR regulator